MRFVERSRDRVESRLAALQEAYASYPVNQTTLSVSGEAYERAADRCAEGLVDAHVRVYNDAGEVLLVEGEDSWVVPSVVPPADARLEPGIRRGLREDTGVECRLTGLDRVTILGVQHEADPDREPIYRLLTVFTGEFLAGAPGDGAAWREAEPDVPEPTF